MASYITGLGGVPGAGYFTDQNGLPRLWVATETWGLPVQAGHWTAGGDWKAEFDNFFSQRAAQGFTVVMTDPVWGPPAHGAFSGSTWDGLTPLAGGGTDPSAAGLDSTFWTRTDYMLASAAANGITVALTPWNGDNQSAATFTSGWSNAQWTSWATLLGTRYAATPNLIWLVGNDAFSPFDDSQWNAILTGLAAAGDTHLITPWYNAECTSRYITDTGATEPWGVTNAAFNFAYSYNAVYWIIEYAYREVAAQGAAVLLPVILGDGWFYTGNSGDGYTAASDRFARQMWWWALASGARGVLAEAENVYPWSDATTPVAVTGDWFFANNAANIVAAFTSLQGWHRLIPDTGNTLITAGRGTRISGSVSGGGAAQYSGFGNTYAAASRTPDKTLAVIYMPDASNAITVDAAQLATGYGAKWVDPVSGATTAATIASTYSHPAANSVGDPDWVLTLAVPPYATWAVP